MTTPAAGLGGVLFARAREDDHVLLEAPGFHLIVHRMVGGDLPDAHSPHATIDGMNGVSRPLRSPWVT